MPGTDLKACKALIVGLPRFRIKLLVFSFFDKIGMLLIRRVDVNDNCFLRSVSMLPKMSPKEVYARLQAGEIRLIDIREPSEYAEVSIAGARLIPLAALPKHPLKALEEAEKPVVFTCHSGNRTTNASAMLEKLAPGQVWQMEGGLSGWEQAGLPVERTSGQPLPLFRQIQIAAGLLILLGVVGSAFWHPMFLLTAFVGAGLVFAGITGFCGLGILLSKMPWNTRKGTACCTIGR